MAILVSGVSLPFDEAPGLAIEKALKVLGLPSAANARIAKRSVDARRRDRIAFVYTVAIELQGGEEASLAESLKNPHVRLFEPVELEIRPVDTPPCPAPVIVGFGPAGMMAGLLLARGGYRPLILERGADIDSRVNAVRDFWQTGALDINNNAQFGEGGAGAFSDGKLTTRIGDARADFVIAEFARHGAPADILYNAKPHVGTDKLREVVKSIRREIVSLGGRIIFNTALEDINQQNGRLRAIRTSAGEIEAETLILAVGHSARDTFGMLLRNGLSAVPKPFSAGVRIEHLQNDVDKALYGRFAGHPLLPKGEYQLSRRHGGRAVYTFCMCPGGFVVPCASEPGMVVTNGMSEYARDGKNANSALVVSVDARDFGNSPMSGVDFQRMLETAAFRSGGGGYAAPAQTAGLFLQNKPGMKLEKISPSYSRGVSEANLNAVLPGYICDMLRLGMVEFEKRLLGFAAPGAVITGVESRTSSPLRFVRGDDLQAICLEGVYPCGEGAGYAGGIVSAAVDGIRCAQAVMTADCHGSSGNHIRY